MSIEQSELLHKAKTVADSNSSSESTSSLPQRDSFSMSRREMLSRFIGLAVASFFPQRPLKKEIAQPPVKLESYLSPPPNKENAANLAIDVAEILEQIRPESPVISNLDEAIAFQNEFVPYLAKAGYKNENTLIYPEIVIEDFGGPTDLLRQYFSFGRTQCRQIGAVYSQPAIIRLNSGFFEENSYLGSLQKKPLLVATIAHEDCHANELSCEQSDYVEAIAQLASTNALFAMAMDKVRIALPAALFQIQDMARSYYLTELIKEGNLDEYYTFLAKLPQAEQEIKEWELIQSFWQDKPSLFDAFVRGITYYGRMPYEVLSDAMVEEEHMTTKFPRPYSHLSMNPTFHVLSSLSQVVEEYLADSKKNTTE
jgi:hypothetical protein